MVEQKTAIGLDFDGVMVKKPKAVDILRRATKMGLPPLPGVHEALQQMSFGYDLSIAGIYTVRPSWLRTGQTQRQVERHGFTGIEKITHTNNSPKEKIRRLLFDTVARDCGHAAPARVEGGAYTPSDETQRVILVDDSYGMIIAGIDALGEEPEMHPLLNRLVFFAFGRDQGEVNWGKDHDPATAHVMPHDVHIKWGKGNGFSVPLIGLPDWSDFPDAMGRLQRLVESPSI